jgi:hypothetical protein
MMLQPPRATAVACPCDCDEDGAVTVDELLTVTNIALGIQSLAACPSADTGDGDVTVEEIVDCVGAALSGCPMMETSTPSPTPTPTPVLEPTATPADVPPIPTTARELQAWLQAGYYKGWTAESARHRPAGPHGALVRTFLNDIVLASLQAGNASHPAGAALVKEIYSSATATQPQLWAVSIKTRNESANGTAWYWWEGSLQGFGHPTCVPCHRGDYGDVSRDFVLTPFPLQ